MNIKELLKQLNEKYPVVEDQHYITYDQEYDCLVVWTYVTIDKKLMCNGHSFLESELEDINKIMEDINTANSF